VDRSCHIFSSVITNPTKIIYRTGSAADRFSHHF